MSKAPLFDQKVETNVQDDKKDDDEEKFFRESFDLAQDVVVKWVTNKTVAVNQKNEKSSQKKKLSD